MKLTLSISPPNLGDDLEEAIRSVAVELAVSRDEMHKVIVRKWLE